MDRSFIFLRWKIVVVREDTAGEATTAFMSLPAVLQLAEKPGIEQLASETHQRLEQVL